VHQSHLKSRFKEERKPALDPSGLKVHESKSVIILDLRSS